MVERYLDGTVGKTSADQEIRKSNAIVHHLWKIWRPTPSGTRSYGRQAVRQLGRQNLSQVL